MQADSEKVLNIIANPRAGHGSGGKKLDLFLRELRCRSLRFELYETEGAGHAARLAGGLVGEGVQKLVVVGGDGTISEVVNGLRGRRAELGIVSIGTGNDVARSLHLPLNDPVAALEVILSGRKKDVDVGRDRDHFFLSLLGVGFPAVVAAATNEMRFLRGSPAFFVAVYKALHRMQVFPVCMELDEGTLELECTSILVQNTPFTGGGLLMAPEAKMDDGLFDVVVVDRIGKLDLMWNFPKVYKGRHFEHPSFSVYRSRQVKISSPEPLVKMFDGDLHGTLPAQAAVLPRALQVIVPAGGD